MKWLGTKRIKITSIVLPGNFGATKAAERIGELATHIRRTDGPIHHPVVEASSMRLLAGHDRIAALMKLKEKHVEVRLWEGTPQEFREVQIIENLGRRADDQNALIAELVRIEEGEIVQERAASSGTVVPEAEARQKVTRGVTAEARERVAKVKGVTPETVRKSEQRAKAKELAEAHAARTAALEAQLEEDTPPQLPAGFEAFGLEVGAELGREIELSVERLQGWDGEVRKLLSHLTTVEKLGGCLATVHVQKIRDRLQAAGHAIRDAIPTSLCFYCKAQPAAQKDCAGCGGTGVVGRYAADNVPAELKAGGAEARVAMNGKFVPVGSAANAAEAAKPVKTIRVVMVDEHGEERQVDLDREAAE